jgi:hypothetical protein
MDPMQCLKNAIGAYIDGEYDTVFDCLVDYKNWRERGGFCPDHIDGWENATDNGDKVSDRLWAGILGR